jgi:prepilin peptidase CpaA
VTGLAWALWALFAALAAAGGYCDARYRTIPNALTVPMALAGLASVWLLSGSSAALYALAHFAVALVLGILAYGFKLWGGGDAKFYAATAAWFPLADFPRLIMAISLAGVVLVLGWLGAARLRRRADGIKRQLPYGLAIAAGGLLTVAGTALGAAG